MIRQRIAVSAFFFVNGFLYANCTSRMPEVQAYFGISNSQLGSLLFMVAGGALTAMPLSGWLSTRFGSKDLTLISGLIYCCLVPLLVCWPQPWLAALFFYLMGMSIGSMDVAMNGQAVYVERSWGQPIMSSFHAVFSIGMALGAASGSGFSRAGFPLFSHLLWLALPSLLLLGAASRFLIEDKPQGRRESGGGFRLPVRAVVPLGVIAFCCMTGEGSMVDWSALYLSQELGQDAATGALAFGTFGLSMTLGRLAGDRLTRWLGASMLLTVNAMLAIAGLSLALLLHTVWAAFGGFFLVGLGLSTMVPLVYSAAGNTPGVTPSAGIAMATSIGYAGFFVGPPVIGLISERGGLRLGLGFTLLLFGLMLALVLQRSRRVQAA
jgi:fucose permease